MHTSNRSKIKKVIENKIKNIHPDKQKVIYEEFEWSNITGEVALFKAIKNYLGISKPVNKYADEYWIVRGWDKKPASIKQNKTGHSPFSLEFWMDKGYTKNEAEYIRNSKRPIRKEYWMEKGYDEEESTRLAYEHKKNNDFKGSNRAKERTRDEHRLSSKRCYEYWLSYHMGNEEKAIESLRKYQSHFSLQKCIDKHGDEDGYGIWKERQVKWQATLNSKSKEEQDNINKRKSWTHNLNSINKEDLVEYLVKSNRFVCKDEFIKRHKSWKENRSNLLLKDIETVYDSVSIWQWIVLGVYGLEDCEKFMTENFDDYDPNVSTQTSGCNYYSYKRKGLEFNDIMRILKDRAHLMSKEEFIDSYKNTTHFKYNSVKKIYGGVSMDQWCVLGVETIDDCRKFLIDNMGYDEELSYSTFKVGYGTCMFVDEGMLRSTYEIAFYEKLMERGIDFELERCYPNSSMRCDFYVDGVYVEIAPMYNNIEEYRTKMDKKEKLFGCYVLTTTDVSDYDDFIDSILKR